MRIEHNAKRELMAESDVWKSVRYAPSALRSAGYDPAVNLRPWTSNAM